LTVGTWLAGVIGPRDVFLYLAVGALITLPMAFLLPSKSDDGPPMAPSARPSMFPKPDRFDILIFWMGAGIDGIFTFTIVIMFAQQTSVELAMVSGGLILAARRIAEMVAAPASGAIADKFGVRGPLIASSIFVVAGFVLVGMGWLVTGSLLIVIARGALGTLFPAAVAHFAPAGVLQPLARNQTWRDIGAAAGPLGTGVLLGVFSPEVMHLAIAVIYAISFIWLMMSPIWRRGLE
jgi:predicted MFS family arabinose efflux permease